MPRNGVRTTRNQSGRRALECRRRLQSYRGDPARVRPADLTDTARHTVDVRPLTADELDVVERTLARYPGKHRERLQGQRRGESVYLIAWEGNEPVGHLNLRLRGRKLPDRARRFAAAQIEDLRVARAHRRRGVARQLMRRAANEAAAHGFSVVGLGVDVDNTPARRLYFAEGYEESGTGEFIVSYPYIDEEGYERQAHETCTYLVKKLS